MRAYRLHAYGSPENARLEECPMPEPAAGEVRIRVQAAGLNPVDYKIREGKLRAISGYRLPCVLGNELAGAVEACGAGATRFALGARVFARVAKERLGAFADYACVREDLLAPVPDALDAVHAAGVPLAALTALQALREQIDCRSGTSLLITGGAGGVGSFAIPLAKLMGARVTTTASPRGADLVKRLGADEIIDYTSASILDGGRRFDAAFDLVGGDSLDQCFEVTRSGGRVVSIAGLPESRTARIDLNRGPPLTWIFSLISRKLRARARRNGVDYRYLFMRPDGAQLAELAALIAAERLPVTLDRVFPFEQIAEAMAWLEAGHAKGKIVVRMDGSDTNVT